VVGSSDTGSGKTLAFGLPLLQGVIAARAARGPEAPAPSGPTALVLCPTRELALQVCEHLSAVAKHARGVRIVPIVGGVAMQKQQRLLSYTPDVVRCPSRPALVGRPPRVRPGSLIFPRGCT
jgi:ATP-dependent RNA helicase DDX24/MAK5